MERCQDFEMYNGMWMVKWLIQILIDLGGNMMKFKKLFALLLVMCLVVSLMGACGNSENAGTDNGAAQAGEDSDKTATVAGDTNDADDADDEDDEEIAEINMVYLTTSAIPSGLSDVEAAINEITEAEINTHVKLEVIEAGSYEQQVGLKSSSGEKVDLLLTFPAGSASFNNMTSQHQLMDISGYLEEFGQGVLDTAGELVSATSQGDAVYGVTTYRSLVSGVYIVMRTDVLESLGLLEKAQNMTSLTEYEEILQAVKDSEEWNYLAGIAASNTTGTCLPLGGAYLAAENFSDDYFYDQLGDLNKLIAIDPDGSDATVVNNFKTEEYKAMYLKMKEWYDNGYVYRDVTTQSEAAEEYVKSNVVFSYFSLSEIGVESAKAAACGMPMTCVKLTTLPVTTSSCTKFVWTVPVSATEPEAAVKFLNMMYTDSRIANLLAWGIEGTHYQVKDGVAYYMDGEDANNCAYHAADFLFGNQFLVLPWEGMDKNFREAAKAEMDSAVKSAYLGFSCDTSNLQNELSAVGNAIAEYLPSIDSGIAAESDYEAFLEKLDKSGAQTIIDEYQTQLNAWIAGNGGTPAGNSAAETPAAETDGAESETAAE